MKYSALYRPLFEGTSVKTGRAAEYGDLRGEIALRGEIIVEFLDGLVHVDRP
jgi:hypothetical protein